VNTVDRRSTVTAIILIGLGVMFLAFNTIPGLSLERTWPVIFFVVAAGFYLPPLAWPSERKGLSALFIPGSILLTLGLIFFYNTLTNDWESWAYAWTLIPGGVGLGLALAARFGEWGRGALWVGVWMIAGALLLPRSFTRPSPPP